MDNTDLINEYIKLLMAEVHSLTTANVTLKAKFNVLERELQNAQNQLQHSVVPVVENNTVIETVNAENSWQQQIKSETDGINN